MQVDFGRILYDYKGLAIIGDHGKAITLREVSCTALVSILADDKTASLEDKMERDDLASLVWRSSESEGCLELAVEKVAIIKRRVNATYPGASVVASAARALEAGPQAKVSHLVEVPPSAPEDM